MTAARIRAGRRGARRSDLASRLAPPASNAPARPIVADDLDDDTPVVGPWAGLGATRKRQADALAARFTQATPTPSRSRRTTY